MRTATPTTPHRLSILFFVVVCLLVGPAQPADADLNEEARLHLRNLDHLIQGFTEAEPCGLEGINPNVTGRCISVNNGGDDIPLEQCTSGGLRTGAPSAGHATKAGGTACSDPGQLSLDLWILSRTTRANGAVVLTVVATGRDLWTVPTVRTSCGSWQLDMVIDPPSLQSPSTLMLEPNLPDSEHGSASGILNLGIRSRFSRADGAVVEIPGLIELDLAALGTSSNWSPTPDAGEPGNPWAELWTSEPQSSCWHSQWIDGRPVLVNVCHEPSCADETPPCSPWCVEVVG